MFNYEFMSSVCLCKLILASSFSLLDRIFFERHLAKLDPVGVFCISLRKVTMALWLLTTYLTWRGEDIARAPCHFPGGVAGCRYTL